MLCLICSIILLVKSFFKTTVHAQIFNCETPVKSIKYICGTLACQYITKRCCEDVAKVHDTIAIKTAWNNCAIAKNGKMCTESLAETTLIAIIISYVRPFKW